MRNKLKKRRKELGYTQERFAETLGISKRTYEQIEQGLRFPREKLLKSILNTLKCDSVSLLDNEEIERRGKVTQNICWYMNELSVDRKYTIYEVSAIRRCLSLEHRKRKDEGIQIKSKTKAGKYEIYRRVVALAAAEYKMKLKPEDVELFKKCTRQEFTDRTGKCTWSLPDVRRKLGHNPITGY